MNSYIISIIILVIGVYIGMKISDKTNMLLLKKILSDFGITQAQIDAQIAKYEANTTTVPTVDNQLSIVVEQHGNTLYAFDHANDTFVAQAQTGKELVKQIQQRYRSLTRLSCHAGAELLDDELFEDASNSNRRTNTNDVA